MIRSTSHVLGSKSSEVRVESTGSNRIGVWIVVGVVAVVAVVVAVMLLAGGGGGGGGSTGGY